jgi:hypothetical protein
MSTVFGLAFGVWGLSIGARPLDDNSFFTHLATGRLIIDSGVPTADPYSFTAAGEPWVVQSWLVSALWGLTERHLGLSGVQVTIALMTGALGVLTWMLTSRAKSLIPRVAICGLVLGVGEGIWTERPLLIGLLGLALVLLAADDRLDPRWLVPVMWIWVNSHGSFPLAVLALICLAVGARLDGQKPEVELRALAWSLGGIVLGVVGPLGPKVLLFPLNFVSQSEIFQHIIEWQSPSFTSIWSRLFLLQAVLAIVGLARRPSYRAAIPTAVFLAAALVALRNIPSASLVLALGMSTGLAELGSVDGRARSKAAAVGAVAMTLLGVLVVAMSLQGPQLELSSYPVVAYAWSEQQGLVGDDRRVATPDDVGNWLEGRLGSDADVFIDDRYDMYPAEVSEAYLSLLQGRPDWREALDDYEIDTVIWKADQPLVALLADDPSWRTAFNGDGWVVACRRGTSGCDE